MIAVSRSSGATPGISAAAAFELSVAGRLAPNGAGHAELFVANLFVVVGEPEGPGRVRIISNGWLRALDAVNDPTGR